MNNKIRDGLIIGLNIAKHRLRNDPIGTDAFNNVVRKRNQWERDNKANIITQEVQGKNTIIVKITKRV